MRASVTRLLYRNGQILDPEAPAPRAGCVLVEDGRIAALLAPDEPAPGDAAIVDLRGGALAPGFIDLHYHGELVFSRGDQFAAALARSSASLVQHGTTAFLATTIAWPASDLEANVSQIASILTHTPAAGAVPIGIHLEGPWINPRAAGAQPEAAIHPFARRAGAEVLDRGHGSILMVTLAPEIEGAQDLLAELERRSILASLGHSLIDADRVPEMVDRGMRHVTHLFNAMGGTHHRHPGAAAAALTEDRLSCDLICDGVHVHPRMVRLAARVKGEQLVLITDRIDLPGDRAEPDAVSFGSGELRDDGTAVRLPGGELAGSRVTLDRAIRNAIAFGAMTQIEAVAASTLRPARLLGIESERGSLRQGARADLVILDGAGQVCETWIAGRRIYPS